MAKGLKEQQIAIIHIPTDIKLFTYNIAHIQACCLAKMLIYSPAGLLVRHIVK